MSPRCAPGVFKERGVLEIDGQCENPPVPQTQAFLLRGRGRFHSISLTHALNDRKHIKQQNCQDVQHKVPLQSKWDGDSHEGVCMWDGMCLDGELFLVIGGSSLNPEKKMSCV